MAQSPDLHLIKILWQGLKEEKWQTSVDWGSKEEWASIPLQPRERLTKL